MEQTAPDIGCPKWFASPVVTHQGSILEVRAFLPRFERRTFGLELLPTKERDDGPLFVDSERVAGMNRYYDTIVRQPLATESLPPIPVGIVSRQYALIQHQELVDAAINALAAVKINPSEIKATLDLTEYGERMRLCLLFPEKYNLKLDATDQMGLRLECVNSVDGSMKFMAFLGWLRFICSNGMVVGVADTDFRRRHNRQLEIGEIAGMLREGIAATTSEGNIYRAWKKRKISEDKLAKWTENVLAKKWGAKAATRAWHITRGGRDVTFADPFEQAPPTRKSVIFGEQVPGSILPGDNVFAISQALAWLAKERRDLQEQLDWQKQIPDLIRPLLGRAAV